MNYANLVGEIREPWIFNHEHKGQRFVQTTLKVNRKSKTSDFITIVSLDGELPTYGTVRVNGTVKSRVEGKIRMLYVQAESIKKCDDVEPHNNEVFLSGRMQKLKKSVETRSGEKLTTFMLCAKASKKRMMFVPAVVWDDNADRIKTVPFNVPLSIGGRIQTREVINDFGEKLKIADVSVFRLEVEE